MRSLITGIAGFAGGHLAAELVSRSEGVAGFSLGLDQNEQLAPLADRLQLLEGDILDGATLRAFAEEFRPDTIFHLAAVTHVAHAWEHRRNTLKVNVIGTAAVLEVAGRLDPKPTVVLASSGQVYGPATVDDPPFCEDDPPNPQGPYAASKSCAELLARQACTGEGIPTVILRTFNYTGAWQLSDFVCSDFGRQVAWAEAGLGPSEITVGNLEAQRDFTDVRDIVNGYILAASRGTAGRVYNLATGKSVRIGDVLDHFVNASEVEITVCQDPDRLRSVDLSSLVGDASRAREELGWKPTIPLEETLDSVLDFWRQQSKVVRRAS